jgi:hypothetical protein
MRGTAVRANRRIVNEQTANYLSSNFSMLWASYFACGGAMSAKIDRIK